MSYDWLSFLIYIFHLLIKKKKIKLHTL
jgi:hypothetical protein